MSDEIKYTQDETGARTFSFTLTPEQLASDQFLGDIKDGADLIKSWESQKSMIGAKMIPSENATDAEWAKYYEKTRPSDGKYGLEDESLEKFASDNGLTKKQAAAVAARIKEVTTLGEDEIGAEALDKQLSAAFGEKVGEVVAQVNEVMKLSWSEEENKSFEKLPNSMQVLVAKGFKAVLDKFGVKAADFQVGTGGAAAAPAKSDYAAYEKERNDLIAKNGRVTDFEDRDLRAKHKVGYIDVSQLIANS